MKQIHRLTIAVPANDDVPDVVDDTAELQPSRFARVMFILEELTMRYKVARISYHKHVADVGVTESM